MIIELHRAHTPEDYGQEEACAICGESFLVESVEAQISDDSGTILGQACPTCVGMLGRRKPERFPTLEEYEAARRRFQGPIWETTEEASEAWKKGAPHRAALEASRIERTVLPSAEASA